MNCCGTKFALDKMKIVVVFYTPGLSDNNKVATPAPKMVTDLLGFALGFPLALGFGLDGGLSSIRRFEASGGASLREEVGVAESFVGGGRAVLATIGGGDEGLDLLATGSFSVVVVVDAGVDTHLGVFSHGLGFLEFFLFPDKKLILKIEAFLTLGMEPVRYFRKSMATRIHNN